ncbi:DUF6970 domain-containing protein [Hymenobacter guriensis]|uniref:DUF6970 domain-containing protein n=1 Tax=Hymenobacter guriensis TaxID=2793065 RepID=UPI001E3180E6|nr:hypothetical protein [Hymenobacter guriensis]
MRLIFSLAPLAALLLAGACARRPEVSTPANDNPREVQSEATSSPSTVNPTTSRPASSTVAMFDTTARPAWLQKRIAELGATEKPQNPKARILSYRLDGQLVYYFNAPCCDQYSTLYSAKGTVLCRPDGGFTGRGDGKCPDFEKKRTEERLVWEDPR